MAVEVAPGHSRVTVEMSVLEAFQVVAALSHRLGYFEGMARDMLAARQERGVDKPDSYEDTVATAITQIRRAERAIDSALMGPSPLTAVRYSIEDGWIAECTQHGAFAIKDEREDAELAAARHLANRHSGIAA